MCVNPSSHISTLTRKSSRPGYASCAKFPNRSMKILRHVRGKGQIDCFLECVRIPERPRTKLNNRNYDRRESPHPVAYCCRQCCDTNAPTENWISISFMSSLSTAENYAAMQLWKVQNGQNGTLQNGRDVFRYFIIPASLARLHEVSLTELQKNFKAITHQISFFLQWFGK